MTQTTVIIPSYNRPSYLNRAYDYWSQSQFKIIIITNTVGNYPNAQVIVTEKKFFEKISEALHRIETKYCILCPDDDFMGLSALEEAESFLEQHPDFSSVTGNIITFGYTKNSQLKFYPRNTILSETNENLSQRITSGFKNYSNNYWSLYRTETFSKIISICLQLTDYNLAELIFKLGGLLDGKIHSTNKLFWWREQIEGSWGSQGSDVLVYLKSHENKISLSDLNKRIKETFSCKIDDPINLMTQGYNLFSANRNQPSEKIVGFRSIIKSNKMTQYIWSKYKDIKAYKEIMPPTDLHLDEKKDFELILRLIKQYGPLSMAINTKK